jgi:hypothetical protein
MDDLKNIDSDELLNILCLKISKKINAVIKHLDKIENKLIIQQAQIELLYKLLIDFNKKS